ncbi:MAG: hypothetical protein ACRCWS_04950 [Propionibacteriaceae bacterium]
MTIPETEQSVPPPVTNITAVDELLAELESVKDLDPELALAKLGAAHDQLHKLLTEPEASA